MLPVSELAPEPPPIYVPPPPDPSFWQGVWIFLQLQFIPAIVVLPLVIAGLKSGAIGHLGLDVYEEEAGLFFEDMSDRMITDDVFARLLTFPNVLVTGHQGFFTKEALTAIAQTTMGNIGAFAATGHALHEVPGGGSA